MSILAGLFNRRRDVSLDSALVDKVERSVSRDPNDTIVAFRNPNVALFKLDVGAYGAPAVHTDGSGSVSMLAGEPLLDDGSDGGPKDRSHDLERMHAAFARERWALFAQAHGVYCAVHYGPDSGTLTLVTDRLGIRPIYYWMGEEYVIFASALHVLERLSEVPKRMDLIAVTEIVMLDGPVGSRTAYADIKAMKAGEILRFTQHGERSLRYWRWDNVKPSSHTGNALFEEAYDRFRAGVRRRLAGDASVFATLSGGLDSRCVVAALSAEDVTVNTVNLFGTLQSQDRVFAARFAEEAGTNHLAVSGEPGAWLGNLEQKVSAAWRDSPPSPDDAPERPQMLWTGDGGSVGVGHVMVDRDVVAALRSGQMRDAIRAFQSPLVPRVLRDPSQEIAELVEGDIRAELEDLQFDDPGRSLHLFIVQFEQRYHLAQHFENIDIHRLEFHLPFFDSDFLTSIVAAPVDLCLGHGFYTDWLGNFPPAVTAVPWQAYPGHRPCPLPIPAGLEYQWDRVPEAAEVKARQRELLVVAGRVLGGRGFPDAILDERRIWLARWMCRAGSRRGQGTIKAAAIYHEYWLACGGQVVVGPAGTLGA